MNWYVLYTLGYKSEKIVKRLNKRQNIEAFIPKYEFYFRKTKEYYIKPLFPGYVFIKSNLNQLEFNMLLMDMAEERDGVIRQLTNEGISALTDEEIQMFKNLLDEKYIVRMSEAYIENGKAVIYIGPLKSYENHIVKVDRSNQCAYLDLTFMDRKIKVGLKIQVKTS